MEIAKNFIGNASGIATTKLTDWHIGGSETLNDEIAFLESELAKIK